MTKRRVVITGMGAVTPFGVGVDKFWNSIKEGKSGTSTSESIDISKHVVHVSAEVKQKDFNPEDYMDPKEIKKTDRFVQFAMVAADEAIKDAKLEDIESLGIDPYRVGVIVSSAAGGFKTFEDNHIKILERGPDAFRSIQYGDADIVVAGGCEATICDVGVGAFSAARTLSRRNDDPSTASRPYDIGRDGFVMGEGAGVLVLEDYEHAKARGAHIYAEIAGYGQTADAYDVVAPDPEGKGAIKAMEFALKDAELKPEQIQYINTHGTSTGLGDKAESHAVAALFGDKKQNPNLFVSSTKSMHGHMLGATGAVEAIACVKTINDNVVPPTINLEHQDPEVADLNYVPHKAVKSEIHAALSNSFGFGGQNASLIFKEV